VLTRIGLNAHLLAAPATAGFRRAGIHGYIDNLLGTLPAVASLSAPDHLFTVLVGRQARLSPNGTTLNVRRSRMDTSQPLRRIFWEQAIQPWALATAGLDLVHHLAFAGPLFVPALRPPPTVVTVYDLSFMRYPERLPATRRAYLRLFTALTCQRARRVLAISQSTADDLTALLGIAPDKIDLAIPGVDPHFRRLPAEQVAVWRTQQGLPEHFVLYLGTLEPRKNLPVLLRAFAALPETVRNEVKLVLAGAKGWMADAIDRTITETGLGENVLQPGFVPDEDLVWWYNAARVFVYPSVFEGWGLPVAEAMACGLPVLTSAVSSLPEVVGEVGYCLPPDDVSAWQTALHHALTDSAWRAEQSERGRSRAARFTWQHTAHQTLESYQKALS
jgi:glycosyltransferase involved in cell wall biosynthesis